MLKVVRHVWVVLRWLRLRVVTHWGVDGVVKVEDRGVERPCELDECMGDGGVAAGG